jgi:hypothetical protein
VAIASSNGSHQKASRERNVESGIAFIEAKLHELDADALSELCREWSVPRSDADAFTRDQARRAWVVRQRLSAGGQQRFDFLPLPIRLQLTELFHEVLEPVIVGADVIRPGKTSPN